jgi:hypothetical protein
LNLESQPEHQPGESALPTHLPKGLLAGGESTPHPRLRLHKGFPSIYLADKHDIIVYVPPCYDRHPERTYPVLYMQDGQNLFDGRTSFIPGRTWQMREHADAAIEAGEVEPLVIVGIYNAGDRRIDEYTHERDWQMGGGGAEQDRDALPGEDGARADGAGRIVAGRAGFSVPGAAVCDVVWQAGAAFAECVVEPQEHPWLPE